MKQLIIIIMLVTAGACYTNAQTEYIEYGYDLSGNRVFRHVVTFSMHESVLPDSIPEENKDKHRYDFAEFIGDCRISIFPNPTDGILKVVIDSPDEVPSATLYLHTITGTKLLSLNNIQKITELDIRNKENGAYILTVVIKGKNRSWKILKN